MNLRDLAYLVSLQEVRGFTAAARRHGVSQPTVTAAIKRLEREFGCRLVLRGHDRQQIGFTPAGRQLLVHARRILQSVRTARQEIDALQQGRVRLGLPPILSNRYFSQIATELQRTGLLDRLDAVERGSAALGRLLADGGLDLALLGSLTPPDEDRFVVERISAVRFCAIVGPEHPLRAAESVRFEDLAAEHFVALTEDFVHARAFSRLCERSGISPHVVYRTDDVGLLKRLVEAGVGIGLLAQSALFPDERVHPVDLADADQPRFHVSIVRRREQVLGDAARGVLAALHRSVSGRGYAEPGR